jgi:membrane glycosyltransferase
MPPDGTTISVPQSTPARVTRRRMGMLTFVVFVTGIASLLMGDLLWGMPLAGWAWLVWALFTVLFALVAAGAAHAFFGFAARRGQGDKCRITESIPPGMDDSIPLAPTAIVMPIYNEEVRRVYAGLRAVYRSVARTGHLEHFDFFILSDSTQPNRWIEEEAGWVELSRELNAHGRLFYRKRRVNSNKKAGNIADFCRRWGKRYRYMIVLDADSVMAGETLVKLVRLMERNPGAGLIQTAPTIVRGETLFARALQFAFRLYGPIFQSGLNYWQQGEGNYWGHNAIIRLKPFIQHCALPALPGREPFGGHILSHDFVEAALLRSAGWAVWLAQDIGGSYEESPPTLIDFAKRDRRWCQGNLQHFWLLFARKLHGISRVHLMFGIFAYSSSLLWLASLIVGTLLVIGFTRTGLSWLPNPGLATSVGLTASSQAVVLAIFTFVLLFITKFLAVVDLRLTGGMAKFGGAAKVRAGVLIESLLSAVLAPVLMLFHAKFVVMTILAQGVHWAQQRRSAEGTSWREAAATHWGHTVVGIVWASALAFYAPGLLPWMSPILFGMVFSIPISRFTGLNSLGQAARRRGWLCTPEELETPIELQELAEVADGAAEVAWPQLETSDEGLLRTILDPYLNAVHHCMLHERPRQPEPVKDYFTNLREKLLKEGPASLATQEKVAVLSDATSLDILHREVWRRPPGQLAPIWSQALRAYSDSLERAPPSLEKAA